jgi:hypothetical protein
MRDKPKRLLQAVWTPADADEAAEDLRAAAAEAILVTKDPNQCGQCGRAGDQRTGCSCLVPPCPVIDLFTKRRIS